MPMQAIASALRGQESEHYQEAVRVLDIILRQHAAKQGCLLVRQSFFHNEPKNFSPLRGGVLGCRGFLFSFRAIQGGMKIDVSTAMNFQPAPVVDFLMQNLNVHEPSRTDWNKRAALVEKSSQKLQDGMAVLTDALNRSNYGADPLLEQCRVTISSQFTQVEGRVLSSPKKVGNGEDFFPMNGRWNYNNKAQPTSINRRVIVNISAFCDINGLSRNIIKCGALKGTIISPPFETIEESPQSRRCPSPLRVDNTVDLIKSKLPGPSHNILCLLPGKKNSDLYGLARTETWQILGS